MRMRGIVVLETNDVQISRGGPVWAGPVRCGLQKNLVLNIRSGPDLFEKLVRAGPVLDFYFFFDFRWEYTGPGKHLLVFVVNFYLECFQNHVWVPLVARDFSIFLIFRLF